MSRYIVFDVETPNCLNNRMSAIGVAVVENGAVTAEYYSLVNPEAGFDSFNVRLTGITPEMVKNQPVFPALWGQIKPLFESGVLVAHYAPFDMGVLDKCLRAYGVGWQPSARYACTCAMGRAAYPGLPNHKLSTLCAHLGIELSHHHAGSDSRAAALLLIDYMQNGIDVKRHIRRQYFAYGRAKETT
ncbi:MAG: 3'-5' exonuclease [Bacillota bacterium]